MAPAFGPDTPILSYGPRAHANPGSRNDRAWLLWPAWAFRVVVPELKRRPINVLQKAVLGVLRASRLTAEELGEKLGVHAELAAFVVLELQTQRRVDDEWRVTAKGMEILDAAEEDAAQLVAGWVFRDPWTGDLWPFVASSLEHAHTEQSDSGYPQLQLGTTGSPWLQRVWAQLPPEQEAPALPNVREILRAALQHARLLRRARRAAAWTDDDQGDNPARGIDLNRITSIDAAPEPVFLTTYLYIPQEGEEAEIDWYACDFFGKGASPSLRQLIARVASDEDRLAVVLDRLLGRTLYGSFEEFKRAASARRQRAQLALERALTLDITQHQVVEPLQGVLEAWLEVRSLEDAAASWRIRNVLSGCRRVLERLFREIAESWPLAGVADQLSRQDREVNQATLRGVAETLGFSALPDGFLHVSQRQVRAVADYNDSWRLRPLVVASLLMARGKPEHPLSAAALKAPDLLARIERITDLGGGAVHDGANLNLSSVVLEEAVQDTVDVVGILLDLPIRSLKEVCLNG